MLDVNKLHVASQVILSPINAVFEDFSPSGHKFYIQALLSNESCIPLFVQYLFDLSVLHYSMYMIMHGFQHTARSELHARL